MDPEALKALSGTASRVRRPATFAFLLRVAVAAALAAAACNSVLWLVASARDWSLTVDATQVDVLGIVLVCLAVALLAAFATYVAARTTKHPAWWVAIFGVLLLLASIQGLPPAVTAMHLVTGAWIISSLVLAVRGGSHVR